MKLFIGTLSLLLAGSMTALAQDIQVIDIRRNITLAEEELPYKDFYLNAGEGSGLKKNLVVQAVRSITIRDASGAQSFGEIQIPVGQLRILAVYPKVTVAREYKLLSRDDFPMLEQIGIMTGDKIDLKSAFVDNKKIENRKPQSLPLVAAAPPSAAPALAPSNPPTKENSKPEVPAEMLEKVASSGN